MEARGEIRGGRFLSGFGGEQYALPEALESLRELRRGTMPDEEITVSAADPMNLSGIVVPGERVPGVPGRTVLFNEWNVYGKCCDRLQPEEIIPGRKACCLLPLKESTRWIRPRLLVQNCPTSRASGLREGEDFY